jgi:hypothetical protein
MLFQITSPTQIEHHSLVFEEQTLKLMRITGSARRHLAARVDHAMPRHVAVRRQRVHGVAGLAGVASEAGQFGDLSVRRDLAARDAADHRPDPFVLRARHVRIAHSLGQ